MERLKSCNLCGSKVFVPFCTKKGMTTKRDFHMVRCSCGLVFVNPRLTEKENARLYDKAYFEGHGFDGSINYVEESEEKAVECLWLMRKVLLFKSKKARVLDVGCGTGSFVSVLEKNGFSDVTGIEFSPFAADFAQKRCRRIILGDILSQQFQEKFDVITATEVIEHLRDPMLFFKKVASLLNLGGMFIYTTGNVGSPYARMFGCNWPYLNPEGHLVYYSPRTLETYFTKCGLIPVQYASLSKEKRKKYLAAEDGLAYFLVNDVGRNSKGVKGFAFSFIGLLPKRLIARMLTRFIGKCELPCGKKV
ncbi:MAG: class I SAM-dependent methyltransferase [Nanoarchaeota archaeon]